MIIGLCGNAGVGKDAVADFLVRNHGFVKVALADPLKRICQDVYGFTDEQLWGPSARRNAPDARWAHGTRDHRAAAEREFADGQKQALALAAAQQPWQTDAVIAAFKAAVTHAAEGWLTPRHALQQLGTDWGRNCSPDTWVRYALNIHDRLQWARGELAYDARTGLRPLIGTGPLMAGKTDIVISDIRFYNEVRFFQNAGGKVVRVVREKRPPAAVLAGPLFTAVPASLWDLVANTAFLNDLSARHAAHISETEQMQLPDNLFDYCLANEGTSLVRLEVATAGLAAALRTA